MNEQTAQLPFKLNYTSKEVVYALGSRRIFQRLRRAAWLLPLSASSDCLFPVNRVLAVQARMERGEMPPLLPSEEKQRARSSQPQIAA